MLVRRRIPMLAVAPVLLALAACKPASEPATADTPQAATGTAARDEGATAGTDAIAVVHHATTDPAGFDRKAFAGRFAGTLPCADCPGIDTQLDIAADGRFTLRETRQGDTGSADAAGTWTIDADGRRLLLDPDVKDMPDRRFEVVSPSELRLLDADGRPVEGDANTSLRRG